MSFHAVILFQLNSSAASRSSIKTFHYDICATSLKHSMHKQEKNEGKKKTTHKIRHTTNDMHKYSAVKVLLYARKCRISTSGDCFHWKQHTYS